jgi:hypothetical protein
MLKRWKIFSILALCLLQFTLFLPRGASANAEGIGIVIASLFGLVMLNEATKPQHYHNRHYRHSVPVRTFELRTGRYNSSGWCRQTKYFYEDGHRVKTLVRDVHCPRSHYRKWRRSRRYKRGW